MGVCGSVDGNKVISWSWLNCCDECVIAASAITKPFPKSSGAFTTSNREVCCCLAGSHVNDDFSISATGRHGGGSRFIGIIWPQLLHINYVLRALFTIRRAPIMAYLDWISICRCAATLTRRSCPIWRLTSSINSPRWIDPRRTMCPVERIINNEENIIKIRKWQTWVIDKWKRSDFRFILYNCF